MPHEDSDPGLAGSIQRDIREAQTYLRGRRGLQRTDFQEEDDVVGVKVDRETGEVVEREKSTSKQEEEIRRKVREAAEDDPGAGGVSSAARRARRRVESDFGGFLSGETQEVLGQLNDRQRLEVLRDAQTQAGSEAELRRMVQQRYNVGRQQQQQQQDEPGLAGSIQQDIREAQEFQQANRLEDRESLYQQAQENWDLLGAQVNQETGAVERAEGPRERVKVKAAAAAQSQGLQDVGVEDINLQESTEMREVRFGDVVSAEQKQEIQGMEEAGLSEFQETRLSERERRAAERAEQNLLSKLDGDFSDEDVFVVREETGDVTQFEAWLRWDAVKDRTVQQEVTNFDARISEDVLREEARLKLERKLEDRGIDAPPGSIQVEKTESGYRARYSPENAVLMGVGSGDLLESEITADVSAAGRESRGRETALGFEAGEPIGFVQNYLVGSEQYERLPENVSERQLEEAGFFGGLNLQLAEAAGETKEEQFGGERPEKHPTQLSYANIISGPVAPFTIAGQAIGESVVQAVTGEDVTPVQNFEDIGGQTVEDVTAGGVSTAVGVGMMGLALGQLGEKATVGGEPVQAGADLIKGTAGWAYYLPGRVAQAGVSGDAFAGGRIGGEILAGTAAAKGAGRAYGKLPARPSVGFFELGRSRGVTAGIKRQSGKLETTQPVVTVASKTEGRTPIELGTPDVRLEAALARTGPQRSPIETAAYARAFERASERRGATDVQEAAAIRQARRTQKETQVSRLEPKELESTIAEVMESQGLPREAAKDVVKVTKEEGAAIEGSVMQRAAGQRINEPGVTRVPRDIDVKGVSSKEGYAEAVAERINRRAGEEVVRVEEGTPVSIRTGEKIFDIHESGESAPGYFGAFRDKYTAMGIRRESPVETTEGVRTTTMSQQAAQKIQGAMKEGTLEARTITDLYGEVAEVRTRLGPKHQGRLKDIADFYTAERANIEALRMRGLGRRARRAESSLESFLEAYPERVATRVREQYRSALEEGRVRTEIADFSEVSSGVDVRTPVSSVAGGGRRAPSSLVASRPGSSVMSSVVGAGAVAGVSSMMSEVSEVTGRSSLLSEVSSPGSRVSGPSSFLSGFRSRVSTPSVISSGASSLGASSVTSASSGASSQSSTSTLQSPLSVPFSSVTTSYPYASSIVSSPGYSSVQDYSSPSELESLTRETNRPLIPGWLSETVTAIATPGLSSTEPVPQQALEEQPIGLKLTGELPTHEMLYGSEETQERIAAVEDLLGVREGSNGNRNRNSGNDFFDFALAF